MTTDENSLLVDLQLIVTASKNRIEALQMIADTLKRSGNYRWVGLYEVDHVAGVVRNLVFSGPGAPAHPEFPIAKGLTGAAIAEKRTINVGDVTADARYLTAFGSTQSEIIVPILDDAKTKVLGTIDVESELRGAFSRQVEKLLQRCADVVRPLWHPNNHLQ